MRKSPVTPRGPRSAYTVHELAERLGLGRVGLYEAIRRGEVPHLRLGRRIILPREAIEEWLRCGRAANARRAEP